VTATHDPFASLLPRSRELLLACDGDGRVTSCDDRARQLLGLREGHTLRDLIAPGCEGKLAEFLARASTATVDDWELPLVVAATPLTVTLSGAPTAHGIVCLGQLVPQPFVDAMEQVNAMIADVVGLNRALRVEKDEVARQNEELVRLNRQLSDSDRGVLSLHAELQQAAQHSHEDVEIKARLVANLTHELRTPLHSILGLTQLLASSADGPLTQEQHKQVGFIRASAQELLGLVNDVLDLGRIESGHARVRIETFDLAEFVASMRGSLRPLVPTGDAVELVIDDAPATMVESDRTKIAQIARNLVSNAIKFTERGVVRMTCAVAGDRLRLTVRDDGVGIAAEDHERIFEEYAQVEHPLQSRHHGTGLGLPLSRRLATLLGGTLTVTSRPGQGATFVLDVPLRHDEARAMNAMLDRSRQRAPDATSVLVVEDDRKTLFLYEKYLVMAGFHVLPARTVEQAEALLRETRPVAIVLDVMLEGDSSWDFLARVKQDPATADIPVLVVTVTNRADKARALGADEFWLKPVDQERLLRKLREIAQPPAPVTVLVVDDDETSRYLIRKHLEGTGYELLEAATGPDGVQLAQRHHPQVILLDFLLDGSTAFDVLDELKADPHTRAIPVIIVTSHVLDAADQRRLLAEAEAVISKQHLSRALAINRIRDALRKLERAGERR
jgi:signal transduction histidine kinase/CheY-like chemotaxis protein